MIKTGLWRIMFAALIAWFVAAIVIGEAGMSRGLLIAIFGLFITFVISWIVFKKYHNLWFIKIFQLTALSISILFILLLRIDSLETERAFGLTKIGFSATHVRENVFVEGTFETTHFAVETATSSGNDYALKVIAGEELHRVPAILWITGEEIKDWGPGTELRLKGFAKEQSAASVQALEINVLEYEEVLRKNGFLTVLRNNLLETAAKISGGSLVPGFAVGDTSLVSAELDSYMKESSLTHLTAVSGSNCALVVAVVMSVSARFGAGRRIRFLLAGGFLYGFVVIVGPDPSIQRAALMAAVTLVSGFSGKKPFALPSLGLAVVLLLLMDPWQAREPGFTLSVAATAGILLFVPALEQQFKKIIKLPRWLTLPISVSIAAQIACAPLLLLLQDGLPVAGVIANILAAPAAPLGTGFGLLALVLLPFSLKTGYFIVFLASFPAKWVEATAEVSSKLPLARWFWPGGGFGALLLLMLEILSVVTYIYWQKNKAIRKPWEVKPKTSPKTVLTTASLTALIGSIFVIVTTVTPLLEKLTTPKEWVFVACDVGQGDASLITNLQKTRFILVDTGDNDEKLVACLKKFGVKKIDLLVLTHDDKDHIGSLLSIIDYVEHALIAPDILGVEHEDRWVVQTLTENQVGYSIGQAGMTGSFTGQDSVVWKILWPKKDSLLLSDNASSLVVKVQTTNADLLLLGDTGAAEHLQINSLGEMLKSDVLKVAHHGSGDFDAGIFATSSAEFGIISAGKNNRYGHPHADVLAALQTHEIQALRTDIFGSVAITVTDGQLNAWLETPE